MKKVKAQSVDNDEMRPEYDFSKLKGAVRGKYYKRLTAGVDLVRFTLVPVPTEMVQEVQDFVARHQKSAKRRDRLRRPGRSS